MPSKKDFSGMRFGKLTVLNEFIKKYNKYYWLCKCDCGNEKYIGVAHLKESGTKSCGCSSMDVHIKRLTTHNMRFTRIYGIWGGMKTRCYDINNANYFRYGGRGIKVCDRWLESFQNFYDDMKDGYDDSLSLDRKNNESDYCKENCKWSNRTEQANNRRTTKLVEYKGEIKTLKQWAIHFNIKPYLIYQRINRDKRTFEQALELN